MGDLEKKLVHTIDFYFSFYRRGRQIHILCGKPNPIEKST